MKTRVSLKYFVSYSRIKSSSKQTNIASSINQSNGNSIRWPISSSSSLVNTSVRLRTHDSHLTCKVTSKCLNVRERVEVVE